jgi:catechol 2,3-dioxygenase-like lactoylglutathione lyase family enzyme
MISGATPTIFVSDLDRAVDFYTRTLGLKLTFHAPGNWASIDAGNGTNLGLHTISPHGPKPGTSGSIQVGLGVTQPIEQVVKALEARGVRFHGPVIDDGQVKLAFFGDPDGNDLYLCEVKKWS